MLDIKFVRQNPDAVKENIKKKFQDEKLPLVDEVIDFDAKFRAAMLDEGVVVAGALGAYAGKAFRIGHMGNATENDMIVALSAVERSLKACGANVELGKAVGTYIAEMKK